MDVIKTALIPPDLDKNLISRENLLVSLQKKKAKKLILLKAGSGYGKTLLASDYYRKLEEKKIWIRVPNNYFTFISLLRYIIYDLDKNQYSSKGTELLSLSSSFTLEEFVIEVINILSDEIKDDLYIIIDDFHRILFPKDGMEDLLKLFFYFTPANVHFIIISHEDLPFSVNKLRLAGDFYQFNQEDFTLNFDEVNELLSVNKIELSLKELNHIYSLTEGWIAILAIVIYSLKQNKQKVFNRVLEKAKLNISEYIKEIIENLPEDFRWFLLETSIFERIEVDICNRYLERNDSLQILNLLSELNLVQQYDKKTFIYHKLLRENLIKNISREKHIKLAHIYMDMGRNKEAITYLINGGKTESALEIILNEAENQLKDFTLIQKWMNLLPEKSFAKNPGLYLYRGKIQERMAKYDEALEDYKRAENYFEGLSSSGLTELNKTRIEIIGIYWYKKEFKKAVINCHSLLPRIEKDDYETLAELYNLLGMSLINLSVIEEGESYLRKAVEYCHKQGNKNKEAWILNNLAHLIYLPAGDLVKAKKNYNRALAVFNEQGDINGQFLIYPNLSDLYLKMELPELAQKMVNEVKIIYKKTKNFKLLAIILILQARINIVRGEIVEAGKNLERVERYILKRKFLKANFYLTKSYFYLAKNRLTESNIWAERAIGLARSIMNKFHLVEFQLQKLKIDFLKGDYDQAISLCNDIVEKCEEGNNLLFLTEAIFYKVAIDKETDKPGEENLERLVDLIEGKDYYFLLEKLDFLAEVIGEGLLKKFQKKNILNDILHKDKNTGLMQKRDFRKPVPGPTYLLKINIFGEFKLIKGEKHLSSADFKNKKALNLLKYLIINLDRWIHQEKILDIFWPELNFKKARQNLYVALYEIRKRLESLNDNQEYILSENSRYKFNTDEPYWFDVEEFQSFYQEGKRYFKANNHLKAKEFYLKGKKIYNNGFLLDNIYDDWTREYRAYYQESYLTLLKNLLEIENDKNPEKALAYGEEILSINPYLEDINIKVIKILIKTGNLKKAFNHYRDLKELYSTELKIEFPEKISNLLENVD